MHGPRWGSGVRDFVDAGCFLRTDLLRPSALDDIPRALAAMRSLVAHKAGLFHCLRKCRGQEELQAAVDSVVGAAGIIRMATLHPSIQERECLAFCALVLGKFSRSLFRQPRHLRAPPVPRNLCQRCHGGGCQTLSCRSRCFAHTIRRVCPFGAMAGPQWQLTGQNIEFKTGAMPWHASGVCAANKTWQMRAEADHDAIFS